MLTRTRCAAALAALAATAALPTVADAKTPELRGVVSGSPYGASNNSMAIPVLFSKETVRSAGLKSPVGVVVLKRTQRVRLPGGAGYALPVNLRAGDRFKGYGPVSAANKRTFYPRVPLTKSPAIYFRSKELSLGELTAAVQALQSSFSKLKAQLDALQTGAIKAFQDIYAQLADLKKAIAALQALGGPDFQSQIDALSKRLNDLIAGLPDFTKFALVSQLPDLTQYVKLTDLTSLLGSNSVITDLKGQITTLQGQVATLTTKLNTVCTAVKNATVTLPAPLNTVVPVTVNTGGVC